MRGRDIVKLPKVVTKAGDWKLVTKTSKMPATAFRLTKRAPYILGRFWHWRVDELAAGSMSFRLLTAFRADTEEFMSWLAMPVGDGLRVIARLEFHGDHPGLHCHSTCEDHEEIPVGEQDWYPFKRAPGGDEKHRRQDSVKTESDAIQRAYAFFGVRPEKKWNLIG